MAQVTPEIFRHRLQLWDFDFPAGLPSSFCLFAILFLFCLTAILEAAYTTFPTSSKPAARIPGNTLRGGATLGPFYRHLRHPFLAVDLRRLHQPAAAMKLLHLRHLRSCLVNRMR